MKHLNLAILMAMGLFVILSCSGGGNATLPTDTANTVFTNSIVVIGYNDLGMHCMNQDFSEIAILPPFNNLYAQVIRRGNDPKILTSGVTVNYSIPGNTHSADKTNFWTYLQKKNIPTPVNVGLVGNGLAGTMSLAPGRNDWIGMGIPVTPLMDDGGLNPYPLSTISVKQNNVQVASTNAVVPVSWEISCQLCHTTAGKTVAMDILEKHDKLHGTSLATSPKKPIICGSCHRQPPLEPLGLHGKPGIETLSRAMHHAHSTRMADVMTATGGVTCYACHPGIQTKCYRDVHVSKGFNCMTCHTSMDAVANPSREPWSDEPRCGSCHAVAGHQYEQAGTLYRNSIGHHGVHCEGCHGSPHAILPTITAPDNVQSINLQGHAGTIDTCLVCHTSPPDDKFPHSVGGG